MKLVDVGCFVMGLLALIIVVSVGTAMVCAITMSCHETVLDNFQ